MWKIITVIGIQIVVIILFIKAWKWYKKEVKDYVDNEQNDVRNW